MSDPGNDGTDQAPIVSLTNKCGDVAADVHVETRFVSKVTFREEDKQ